MKKCTKCGIEKDFTEFNKDFHAKDGHYYVCKQCYSEYRKNPEEFNKKYEKIIPEGKKWCYNCKEFKNYEEFYKNKCNKTGLMSACKLCHNIYNKRESRKEYNKNYTIIDKEKEKLRQISNAKFKVYNNKLTIEEEPCLAEDGISLEVKCKYCREYFIPTTLQVRRRVQALKGQMEGECHLYCSDKCRNSCSIFNAKTQYYLTIKKETTLPYTEYELSVWTETVKANNKSGLCEICGINAGNIAHHELPKKTYPQYALDLSNGIAVCEECHNKLHIGECSTGRLASTPCKLK